MLRLSFGLSLQASLYSDQGVLNQGGAASLGPAARAAQVRDAHRCRYCGFRCRKYQRCVGAGSELAEDLTTACIFCEQVLCVDLASRMRSGVLIWLPEMTQAALNAVMPELYARRVAVPSVSNEARDLLGRLLARRDIAKAEFGSDDPYTLVGRLRAGGNGRQDIDRLTQNGLRLLPLDRRILREAMIEFNQFPQILAYWRSKDGPLSSAHAQGSASFERLLAAC